MKLFGGKNDKYISPKQIKPKKERKKLTKKQVKRRIIISLAVVFSLITMCFAAWKTWVKPPSFLNRIEKNTDNGYDNIDGESVDIASKNRKEDFFTFLVCATDKVGANTDSMMVVSFDIKNQKINVLNVPRDTMSNVSRKNKKINGAYYNGIENTKSELKQLLGFEIDKYMVVNFDGIADIVDAIGGVDYDIPIKMNYDDPTQNLSIHFRPGMQHLNGEQTVKFLRFRKNNNGGGYATGDIGRVENQQKFLKTLAEKMMKPSNVVKVPQIAEAVFKNVKTDFEMGQLVWLGIEGTKINSENLEMHTLPGYPQYVNSLSYYIPSEEEVLELVNLYFNPYKEDITDLDILVPSKTSSSTSKSSSSSKKTTVSTKIEDKEEEESSKDLNQEPEKDNNIAEKPQTDKSKTEETTQKPQETSDTKQVQTPEEKPKEEPVQAEKPTENPKTEAPPISIDPELE